MQKYLSEITENIQKIIRFDSSCGAPEPGAPFGRGARECLNFFLALAAEMGFETHNYDGYVGEVVFGEGEEFAVAVHLDVVPAGTGWTHPPFGGVIEDGKLYGRGAMDDKGPAVICLYALKALKDGGVRPKRKIKLIAGCNEESGWACMEHYKKVAHMPDEGFTPDADFPVIYAEKGILHLRLDFPLQDAPFSTLDGGTAANMVCDCAQSIPLFSLKNTGMVPCSVPHVTLTAQDGKLLARGRAAHASEPEKGANALQGLLEFYAAESPACRRVCDLLFGDAAGLKTLRDETGPLTASPDMAHFEKGILSVVTDFRVPASKPLSAVTHALEKQGIACTVLHAQQPLFNDPNGKLVQTLLRVYNDATGRQAKPIAIGGGTYARAMKNGCGFGPLDEGEESTIHRPDEYISLDKIGQLSEIYFRALKEICS